jgi:hypothetical protein
MNRRNVLVVISVTALLAIVCILATGALIYWALNNPGIGAALKQFTSSLSDITDLQRELAAAYPAEAIQVRITNGHILTISLVNSEVNKLSEGEQQTQAKAIALFAKNHYARINEINTINVALVQQGGAFGINLNFTKNYVFNLSELP